MLLLIPVKENNLDQEVCRNLRVSSTKTHKIKDPIKNRTNKESVYTSTYEKNSDDLDLDSESFSRDL